MRSMPDVPLMNLILAMDAEDRGDSVEFDRLIGKSVRDGYPVAAYVKARGLWDEASLTDDREAAEAMMAEAVPLYESASGKIRDADLDLGRIYLCDRYWPTDVRKAAGHFMAAASAGDPEAYLWVKFLARGRRRRSPGERNPYHLYSADCRNKVPEGLDASAEWYALIDVTVFQDKKGYPSMYKKLSNSTGSFENDVFSFRMDETFMAGEGEACVLSRFTYKPTGFSIVWLKRPFEEGLMNEELTYDEITDVWRICFDSAIESIRRLGE